MIRAITTLALLTGLFMALAGLLRLGRLLRFISNSVVIGFLTGVSPSMSSFRNWAISPAIRVNTPTR